MVRPPTLASWMLLGAPLCLAGLLTSASEARAAATKDWVLRYEPSLEYSTNLQQQAGGTPDLVGRNNVDLSWTPWSTAERSVLLRAQALTSRFQFNPEYNATFLTGTGIGSMRLAGPIFGYTGYQLLLKAGGVNRLDGDLFGGLVAYWPLAETWLLFHGYQADVLRAAVVQTGYVGHSIFLTARMVTTPAWTNSLSLRSQIRLYDAIGEIEWRNQLTAESVYRVNDWFSLVGEAFLVNAVASDPVFTFSGSNVGLFSRFTY